MADWTDRYDNPALVRALLTPHEPRQPLTLPTDEQRTRREPCDNACGRQATREWYPFCSEPCYDTHHATMLEET